MPDFPIARVPNRFILSTNSPHSIGVELSNVGLTATTANWPTASLGIFVPLSINQPVTVLQMFVENGASVNGSIDVGIYTVSGSLMVSSGSTAHAGTAAIQSFDIANTTLNPGLYYLACAINVASAAHILRYAPTATIGRAFGIAVQAAAFPLPASATLTNLATGYIPAIYATLSTTI
jgi:hypothetical protein